MPKFTELLKETGIDPQNNFMVVPLGGSNLVGLHNADGFDYDHHRLEVNQVTREQIHRVSNNLYDQFNLTQGLVDETDSWKAYWAAMHNSLSFGSHSRLLSVTGKMRGLTDIKAVQGGLILNLNVAVVPRDRFTVAFKFLQHLDGSGKPKIPTRWRPSDAKWLISKLNLIYGLQANIFFEMVEADLVRVDKTLGEPLDSKAFLSHIVKGKNQNADLNIFLVGRKWNGTEGDAGGSFRRSKLSSSQTNPKLQVLTFRRAPTHSLSRWRTRLHIS